MTIMQMIFKKKDKDGNEREGGNGFVISKTSKKKLEKKGNKDKRVSRENTTLDSATTTTATTSLRSVPSSISVNSGGGTKEDSGIDHSSLLSEHKMDELHGEHEELTYTSPTAPINQTIKLLGRININALVCGDSGDAPKKIQRVIVRGLLNEGNTCFSNAILQALIHCKPLVRLATLVNSSGVFSVQPQPNNMPYMAAFYALIHRYNTLKIAPTTPTSSMPILAPAISPGMVMNVVQRCSRPSSPFATSGRQQDAEEFLTYFLNELHSELVAMQESLGWTMPEEHNFVTKYNDEDDWMEYGPRGRIATTRMHVNIDQASPITALFGGMMKSVLKTPCQRDSITNEPFQCLPLEIDHTSVNSLSTALAYLTRPELIGQDRSKQVMIDYLSPVTIIQLKRFVYKGEVIKCMKNISIPLHLKLKQSVSQWHLSCIIYHVGKCASGGHYTAHCLVDEQHGQWAYFDDSMTSTLIAAEGTVPSPPSNLATPYLLFYSQDRKQEKQLSDRDQSLSKKKKGHQQKYLGSRYAALIDDD